MSISVTAPIKKLAQEPRWSWGIRLAITVCAPLLYGVYSEHSEQTFWIAIAAQSLAFIELRGNLSLVLRILLTGIVLSLIFCILGSVIGNYPILNVCLMFVVGFFSALFKNLGERGISLSLSVYIFYIITSSFPIHTSEELWIRSEMVLIGGTWALLVAIIATLSQKQGKPFRKSVADIFHEMAVLTNLGRSGFGGVGIFQPLRKLYIQEQQVHEKLEVSSSLFGNIIDQDKEVQNLQALQQIRRIANIINIHVLELIETTQQLKLKRKIGHTDIHVHNTLRVWEQILEMSGNYLISLNTEDKLILLSRINRLQALLPIIEEESLKYPSVAQGYKHIIHLSLRLSKLVHKFIEILSDQKEKRAYSSYSFSKTMSILHPKQFSNEFANLFKLDKGTRMYALRVGLATMLGMIIGYWIFPQYGYWIPFTAIIVAQPYIGATVKKGIQRSIGTLLGVIGGFVFLQLPHPDIINIIMVFLGSIFSIYFLKKQYAISSFFVTLTLVGLISITQEPNVEMLEIRMIGTVIGAGISMMLGFFFISTWDVSMMPQHFRDAIWANYNYLQHSPLIQSNDQWIKYKRLTETANATLYNSYTRWLSEPSLKKNKLLISRYFGMITHLIRVTKELNNIHAEWENNKNLLNNATPLHSFALSNQLFIDILEQLNARRRDPIKYESKIMLTNHQLNTAQQISMEKINIELKALKSSVLSSPSVILKA